MSQFCNFQIIGRLTKDPEVRYTPSGTAIARYTVACNRFKKDKDGNTQKDASFIPVTTYGKQAELDQKYLKKGQRVAVNGSIVSWYDAEKGKGGFNFDGDEVMYLASPAKDEGEEMPEEHREWATEYEQSGF